MSDTISLDNDWEYTYAMTRRDTASGEWEPAADLPTQSAWISATPNGATIHADLSKELSERADTPGSYFAILDGDVIREHLATYVGDKVYEVMGDGENILGNHPLKVVLARRFL